MDQSAFCLFFLLAASLVAVVGVRPSRTASYILLIACVGLALIGMVAFVASQRQAENTFVQIITLRRFANRVDLVSNMAAIMLGLLSGVALVFAFRDGKVWRMLVVGGLFAATLAGFSLLIAKDIISPYLADPNASSATGLVRGQSSKGWKVRKVVDLTLSPAAMCRLDDSTLLVSGYLGGYMQNGGVVRIDLDKSPSSAVLVAEGLTRPHGLAVHGGELYVSRSGQFSRAVGGRMVQENTGAVTRLRDLNGDGIYEYLEDVLVDLPGAKLPDGLHQNNGIVFDKEGNMYVTVGTPTDHAPPNDPREGTVLQYSFASGEARIFANGLRNPFGIVMDEEGRIYCSDNDANNSNMGDRILRIQEGKNYGHPYIASSSLEAEGVERELTRISSAQGLAYMQKGAGTSVDGMLVYAGYGDGSVNALSLASDALASGAKPIFIAAVPSAVAVCSFPDGRIYVCSYSEKAVFEISPER